ncbi:ATP-binding cassette domain-containing protein [Cryobacterium lactosi]|uniref:ATP-binding cassette domain-containing protein n=1 Tax=Cryobacterium lactosi TaxID=1259202 RepID=A0A4R9BGU4_9MICO|nr:zinc ABC transporter ATP-binding protein AztA [Cryobacterium lactosi]TFD83917.1 ATP-binding cassette domain-containing protein [Cryobacterium lactosi]
MSQTRDTAPAASLRGVTVDFAGRDALRGIDLDVLPGCLTVLAGPNGAGKTTLLEVLAGTRPPTEGTRSVTGAVALVPQRTAETDRLPVTVRDVVTVGVWGRLGRWRRLDAAARTAIDDALERLQIQDLARLPFATLSGGQRQRTLLAQGLARAAAVLLLDEPTTGLDSDSAQRIRQIMRAEAESGVAVVCVSHDPEVLSSADRTVHLADGAIAR